MLPETPKMSSLDFPVSPSSSSSATLTTALKPSTHFVPTTTSDHRNLAWQSLPSHDSLDSGVYSRSTTSDSNHGGGNGARAALTSPLSNGRDPSPPSFMRQQFRRIGARLPDPPAAVAITTSAAAAATQIQSLIGSERRKGAPPNKSSELFHEDGSGATASVVPGTSSPHRAFSRHYYHYSCYAAEAGKGSTASHLRDAGFSPIGARSHRVHFNNFMDGSAGAKESEEAKVVPRGEESGADAKSSSPLLSPSSMEARLQIAQSNSGSAAESAAHCDYADGIGEPDETSAALIGAAVTTTTTTEELFYTNAAEDEELLADVDDDDDAFFVKEDGFTLSNPLAASPPPEALKNSSNREIAQVVNRRIRAMLTQDYSSAAAALTDDAPEELPSRPLPIAAAAALEVPKLRDLKSHSFPPPWTRLTGDENEGEGDAYGDAAEPQLYGPLVIADPSSLFAGSEAAAARLASEDGGEESPQAAEERRRRWLLHNHAISCSGGVNGANKEEDPLALDDAAFQG